MERMVSVDQFKPECIISLVVCKPLYNTQSSLTSVLDFPDNYPPEKFLVQTPVQSAINLVSY